jgi:hypothetical protein
VLKTTTNKYFSLNKVARGQEIKRIMQENEAMLKRLQNRGSVYNVTDWELERRDQVKNIKRICKYGLSISTERNRRSRRRGLKSD